jgi:hypothetical protein
MYFVKLFTLLSIITDISITEEDCSKYEKAKGKISEFLELIDNEIDWEYKDKEYTKTQSFIIKNNIKLDTSFYYDINDINSNMIYTYYK